MKTLGKILRNIVIFILVLILITVGVVFFMVYKGSAFYTVTYGKEIAEYAEKYGLDPYLVAGIVKTESDFVEDAVADDGGRGLMQLMPDTAKWCAAQLNVDYNASKMLEKEYNLNLGCYYLSYLIQKYQNEALAVAAYNTGYGNVDKWLEEGTITWERDSMKNIPFPITREYVKKVLHRRDVFSVFYSGGIDEDEPNSTFLRAIDNTVDLIEKTFSLI